MAKKIRRLRTRERNYAARNFMSCVGSVGVWHMLPETLATLKSLVAEYQATGDLTERQVQAAFGYDSEEERPEYHVQDGVAFIPLMGPLVPKPNLMMRWMGGTSTEQFCAKVEKAMADPNVRAVLILADTPGGSAIGCAEAHAALMAARNDTKPLVSLVHNGICASAGYFLTSACDQIWLSPSSMMGSIGTINVHIEYSQILDEMGWGVTIVKEGKFKWAANPYEKLSADGKATIQEIVTDYYRQFVGAVAQGRGVPPAQVEANFGQGKMLIAEKAVAAGLADRVGTIEQVVSELAARQTAPNTRAADPVQVPRNEEEQTVNKLLIKALVKRGLVSAEATEGECLAACRIFYATLGKAAPDMATEEGQMQAIQDLAASNAEPSSGGGSARATAEGSQTQTTATGGQQTSTAPANPGAEARAAEAAQLAERTRATELRERGRTLGIDQETVDAAIDEGTSVDAALRQWTDRSTQREQPLQTHGRDVRIDGSAVDAFAVASVEVLADRCGISPENGLSTGARAIRRLSMVSMAAHALRAQGVRGIDQMDNEDICKMYLRMGDDFSIPNYGSDVGSPGAYPNIFALLGRKILDAAIDAAETTYQDWCAQYPSVPDFHPRTIVAVGAQGELPLWPDKDPIQGSETAEEVSWISVDRYGDEFMMSPVMMANDDLGAFADMAMQKQVAHDLTINRLMVDLLVSNPLLPDGFNLFSTEHANDIAGANGGAPSVAQAQLMRETMRAQTDVSGKQKLRVSPALALLPSQHETAGEQTFLPVPAGDISRSVSGDTAINVFRGKVRPVVEQMLDDQAAAGARNDWFGFAPKERVKSLTYMFQTGFERGKRTTYFDPKTGCRYIQIEGRFGGAVRNFRGVVRNSGGS